MSEEVIDQVEETVDVETEESVTDETEATQEEVEETEEGEESEFVDVEYEGEQFSVPQKLKDALLRQADYTQKTQSLADERRAFDSERQQYEQQKQLNAQAMQRQQANQEAYTRLQALDNQLSQYQNLDTSNLDGDTLARATFEYNQLQTQRSQLAQYISQSEAQATQMHQAELARKIEQGRAQLQKEIPNWTNELAHEVAQTALKIGLTEQEVSQLYEPAHAKALYYAKIGYELMNKANVKPKASVSPIKTVKAGSNGGKVDPEKMTTDEWMKWRNKQANS